METLHEIGLETTSTLDRDSLLESSLGALAKLRFVFQSFNLLTRLSMLKNVELPLVDGRVDAREREDRGRAALAAVGLEAKLHNRPNELSGGQSSGWPWRVPWWARRA